MERQTEEVKLVAFSLSLRHMSPILGEKDIPHPTSVKVNRLFPFLFMGDLVSRYPQGQNLLWCVCNLSSVNEIVKQRR